MKPRRDKEKKLQPEYHLIVTEGTDTEPAYFGAIKEIINNRYQGKIHLSVFGEGDNTLSLLNKARKRVEADPNGYKHVWVVYDTDDFPADHIDRTTQLCEAWSIPDEITYHAIWSNQCIELWFLLHFSYMHSDLRRTEYWPKLSQYLRSLGEGDYTKNRPDMYRILYPMIDFAIANAKRLAAENQGKPPSRSAPGTKVYELIEILKPYLTDE
jgi:hypothetical protein